MKIEILEKTEDKLRFILKDTSIAFANALRRVMISEVPCMAINEIIVFENTSILADEILAQRLGLIPLKTNLKNYIHPSKCTCKSEVGCSRCRVSFSLNVEAKESQKTVYSGDLVSEDPEIVPISNNIPIVTLTPGQKINLQAYARLGIGQEHARWQPVVACAYKYLPKSIEIDKEKCNLCGQCMKVCPKKVLLVEKEFRIVNLMNCTLCKDCEKVCKANAIKVEWDESSFIFSLELTRALSAEEMIEKASEILLSKVEELKEKILKL